MRRASLVLIAAMGLAQAANITILSATSIADAVNERNAWIATNFGRQATANMLTTFEGIGLGTYTNLTTAAGTFTVGPNALGSLGAGTGALEFSVLNSTTTPFSGRYDTTPGGTEWLDSNDITDLKLSTSLTSLFFFITDVNDQGGVLNIRTADGTQRSAFKPWGADGNIYFVGILGGNSLSSIEWLNNSRADGFGVDDFGTVKMSDPPASVPEPGSFVLIGCGLVVLPLMIRRGRVHSTAAGSSLLSAQRPRL